MATNPIQLLVSFVQRRDLAAEPKYAYDLCLLFYGKSWNWPDLTSGVDFTDGFCVDMLPLCLWLLADVWKGMVSASSLLLLLLLLLQLRGFLPQLSRTLGNLNEITALVLSATFDVPLSVNSVLVPVELSSPLWVAEHNTKVSGINCQCSTCMYKVLDDKECHKRDYLKIWFKWQHH